MASPVLPSDFESNTPSPTDTTCTAWTKIIANQNLLRQFFGWMLTSEGAFSDEFLAEIGSTSGSLAAPSGVTASSDRTTDVRVSWSAVSGASTYSLWKGVSEDDLELYQDDLTSTSYDDTSVTTGTVYFYAVKAHSTTQNSSLSSTVSGKKVSATPADDPITWQGTGTSSVTVPAGKTQMELRIWGGGGYGGANTVEGGNQWDIPINILPHLKGGGGGSSGSFLRITGITVAEGDVFVLEAGGPGQPSTVYADEVNASTFAYASGGRTGGLANGFQSAGAAGAANSSYGSSNLTGGTVDAVNSNVGTAGSAGSGTTGGAGGSAVTYGGASAGEGGAGVTNKWVVSSSATSNVGYPGTKGMIKVLFS